MPRKPATAWSIITGWKCHKNMYASGDRMHRWLSIQYRGDNQARAATNVTSHAIGIDALQGIRLIYELHIHQFLTGFPAGVQCMASSLLD
jgi:hypothetical protein